MLFAAGALSAQPYQPTSEELSAIRAKLADLTRRLGALGAKPDAALLADVEVYRKAGEWILRYPEEFYTKAYVANALKVLDHGIARARELERGQTVVGATEGPYRARLSLGSRWFGAALWAHHSGIV